LSEWLSRVGRGLNGANRRTAELLLSEDDIAFCIYSFGSMISKYAF